MWLVLIISSWCVLGCVSFEVVSVEMVVVCCVVSLVLLIVVSGMLVCVLNRV